MHGQKNIKFDYLYQISKKLWVCWHVAFICDIGLNIIKL
jgi:hypothetical protein